MFNRTPVRRRHRITTNQFIWAVLVIVLATLLLELIFYGYTSEARWVGVAHQTFRDWFELMYPALAIALVAWLFAQLVARGQDEGRVSPMVIAVATVGIVGGLVIISYSLGSAFRKGSLDIPPLFSRQAQAPSQLFCLTTFCNSCGTGHKENARKRWNAAGHRRQH
jgi:hypothetical protein